MVTSFTSIRPMRAGSTRLLVLIISSIWCRRDVTRILNQPCRGFAGTTSTRPDLERVRNMTTKTDATEAVVIERTFHVPVARVWKALTDADQMRVWYFDLEEFKPEVGFEFEFTVEHEGTKYHHLCKITEVIPQKKIAYTWRYAGEEGDSLVTFELFADGGKTRLKLTHEGLETFPKLPAYARTNFEAGWTEIIGSSLKQFVEGPQKQRS